MCVLQESEATNDGGGAWLNLCGGRGGGLQARLLINIIFTHLPRAMGQAQVYKRERERVCALDGAHAKTIKHTREMLRLLLLLTTFLHAANFCANTRINAMR